MSNPSASFTYPLLASQVEPDELRAALKDDAEQELILNCRTHLNGSESIDDIACVNGISTAQLQRPLSALAERGLVIDTHAMLNAKATEQLLESFVIESCFWSREVLTTRFFRRLRAGDATSNLISGWVIETFHYVAAANEYTAAAVAYCHDNLTTRRRLADRYFEQHQESEVLLKGLVAAGMESSRVVKSFPLASTRALINFLTELAITDWLAFSGALEIVYAVNRGTLDQNIAEYYEQLAQQYPFASEVLDSMAAFASGSDLARRQGGFLLQAIIDSAATEGSSTGNRLVTALRDTYEHFALFFEGVEDYYSEPHILLPRRPLDIRTEL
ncbi:MAG TPA: hypothetical protein VJV03_19010 [Pyrinomonadaceae bacterium]|nr:hypothetical protein [Pyrinomonadaceae bacterium]